MASKTFHQKTIHTTKPHPILALEMKRTNPSISCLTAFFILICLTGTAQLQKTHWYFGEGAAISFDRGKPVVQTNNPMSDYGHASACISDGKTGELIFYTNGRHVWNNQHKAVKTDLEPSRTVINDLLILENPYRLNAYYLITITTGFNQPFNTAIKYYELNVSGNDIAMSGPTYVSAGPFTRLTAVKNCRNDGYWILTFQNSSKSLFAFDLGKNGISTTPVVSPTSIIAPSIGDMVSTDNGKTLAVSGFSKSTSETSITLFDIDKKCGTLVYSTSLTYAGGNYAFGLAFSKNHEFLYATYSVGESKLVQFDLRTRTPMLVAQSPNNFNELQRGPDNKIYISTHRNGIPGPRIDVIHEPDMHGLSCRYEYGVLDLGNGNTSNFHFPNFIQDYSEKSCQDERPDFEVISGCLGDTLSIKSISNYQLSNQFYWMFNKTDSFGDFTPVIQPDTQGIYPLDFIWQVCASWDTLSFTADIRQVPKLELGKDTAICPGSSISLSPKLEDDWTVLWLPENQTNDSLIISTAGTRYLTVKSGNCSSIDSITISVHDSIWTALGNEYYICEDEDDLVTLDAGKGFETYLWHPTRDTTHWIEVMAADSYYVVVEDFRGCMGEDGTVVERRCPPRLFFPTSFTPNGDGLNDVFKPTGQDILDYNLQIYNRWGELIFESDDVQFGWNGIFNGDPSPHGQYLWKCRYTGYRDKKPGFLQSMSGYLVLLK